MCSCPHVTQKWNLGYNIGIFVAWKKFLKGMCNGFSNSLFRQKKYPTNCIYAFSTVILYNRRGQSRRISQQYIIDMTMHKGLNCKSSGQLLEKFESSSCHTGHGALKW